MTPPLQTEDAEAAPRFDETRTPVRPGRALIEASAGTGKTFALVALVLRLVLEGHRAERLLVVTFTRDATEELTRRIREGLRAARAVFEGAPCPVPKLVTLLDDFEARFAQDHAARRQCVQRLRRALAASGDLSVFTIHSFCKHALEEWAFESGTAFQIDFAEEADDLLRRAAADAWRARLDGEPLLAEMAVALEWDVQQMLKHLGKVRRHPDTEIVPAARLEDALADLKSALGRLGAAWDVDELTDAFAPFVWKKDAPVTASGLPERIQQVADACAEEHLGVGLEAIRAFSAGRLREHANKRSTKKKHLDAMCAHAGPVACAAVAEAAERLDGAFVRWFVRAVPRRFRALKRRRRVMTFDDLLSELLRALEDRARGERLAAAIRARYDVALVDEFQDTDPRQYAIFRTIFSEGEPERPVFLIGDAKQAIYRFRGADLYTYLGARREAGRRFTLEKNWRSDTRLVHAVNAVFEQAPMPFLHEDIPFHPVEAEGTPDDAPLAGDGLAPFVWWHYPPAQYESGALKVASKGDARPRLYEATAGEIGRLVGGGEMTIGDRPLHASDMAVLVRSNKQAEKMQAAIQRAGVPAVVSATRSILDTREMEEIERLLRAVLEPRSEHLRAALATELWGKTAREIFDLNEHPARWAALVNRFEGWQDDWRQHGVAFLLTRFIEAEDVQARLLCCDDGERRLTNVRHCVELLREAEERRQQAPSGLMRWLARRDEERLLQNEETELRLESDERAVQVLTLHKSKGLEFGVVFCPFLWHTYFNENQAPLVQTEAGGVVYDLGSQKREAHLDRLRAEELAEEIRLAYVGMTRAVHRCYAVWGDLRSAPSSALGYLLYAGAADLDDAATPTARADRVARTMAVRRVAQKAQCNTSGPDRLRELFGGHEHIDIEPLRAVEERTRAQAPTPPEEAKSPQARPANFAGSLTPWTYASYSRWTQDAHEQNGRARPQTPEADENPEPEDIHAFAAGLRAGKCLHEILERADFTAAPDADKNLRAVRRPLRRHRLDAPERHRRPIDPEGVVVDRLDAVRRAVLPGAPFTFAEVSREKRADEWSFSLPVGRAAPRRLRPAFAEHGSALAQSYVPRLAALDADATDGFLRGAVDLVFEHGGAYYLVDWKSNRLADTAGGYDDEALRKAMFDHHYVLQYHLYAAALQRHLAQRLPAYDHEKHFGGVWYAFLRGLQPGTGRGLVFDRPSAALLSAISRRLEGPRGGR